ncbi:MAG: MinD/ParA family protein [Acidobacteriota bacterium]
MNSRHLKHAPRRAMRIAVTSGKGGVGKTSIAINLSVALARLGHKVGLFDADFALGNVDVMLGLTPRMHMGAVLAGDRSIADVTVEGPSGIKVIPAGSGVRALTHLTDLQWQRLATALDEVSATVDFLVIDTASGISDNVLDLVDLADYALVVTSYEPAAVVDSYATVKLISAADRSRDIGIVVNASKDAAEAELVFRQLSLAADRFLERSLRYDGYIVRDPHVHEAALDQAPVVGRDDAGPAGRCFRRLAQRLAASRPTGGSPWPVRHDHAVISQMEATVNPEAPRCA